MSLGEGIRRGAIGVAVAIAGLAGGSLARSASASAPPAAARSAVAAASTRRAIDHALAGAGEWLDSLPVDADTLRAHGIKGRKKLAEILDAEVALFDHARDASRRARIVARVHALAAQTRRPGYHDLPDCSERELREEGMSYLRVAWLLGRMGLDTKRYRQAIADAVPRFERHLATRGPWQRREFERYFIAFGLAGSTARRDDSIPGGVIARRLAPGAFDLDRAYDLTHEVFVRAEDPVGAGASWTHDERSYLRRTLPDLARRAFARDALDIGAELLLAMAETGERGDPEFTAGVAELLAAQNPDGTWGRYERERRREGGWVEQRLYLHTTMVAIEVLCAASNGFASAPRPG